MQFQFQTGSIRSNARQVIVKRMTPFQFQTGSIRRYSLLIIIRIVLNAFQFQTGSIRSEKMLNAVLNKFDVSIPNWFD